MRSRGEVSLKCHGASAFNADKYHFHSNANGVRMSLKLIAFIVLVVGIILFVSFFVYEGKKREKEKAKSSSVSALQKADTLPGAPGKVRSVHDLFDDDMQQPSTALAGHNEKVSDESANVRDPYEGYVADKYLINRKQHAIYERLENLLSGDFRISPKIRITDLIRPEKAIMENDVERAKIMSGNFNNARFDFVITHLQTGEIRGVVMAENTLSTISAGPFISELLSKMKIPLFRYADTSNYSDDELSNLLYEKFEEAHNDNQ